jgi:outer membrane biosynthesis protein TonB
VKVLQITFNGHELARSPVLTSMILIGRSPSCDIVLRAKGVKPVHFLMEKTELGDESFWSIFDVSGTTTGAKKEKTVSDLGTGEGLVLDKKPVKLGQFEFQWKEDRLSQSVVEGGSMAEAFKSKAEQAPPSIAAAYQLEIVSARTDSGSITQVYHLNPPSTRNVPVPLPGLPALKLTWSLNDAGVPVVMDFGQLINAEVFKKGTPITGGADAPTKSTKLAPGDLVQIHFQLRDHYFRLVPRVNVAPVRPSMWKDAFVGFLALALLVTAAITALFVMIGSTVEEPPKEPPRVAQIEVKEAEPPPPPPEEAPPPEEKKAPEKSVAEKEEKSGGQAAAPKFKAKEPKKTTGLNSPAPVANVNSVGLLGALKAKNPNTVSADKVLNDAIISKTASGPDGFVVQQSPSGVVKRTSHEKTNGDLTGAFTKMAGGDSIKDDSAGPIAAKNGKNGFKVGYKNADAPPTEGFTTEGGLDKESVRRALAAYKKDIRTCYERALLSKPRIKGRIVYKWQIQGEGPVSWVQLQSQDVGSPSLPPCVQKVIQGIKFPAAPNHQPTIVIYPFVFLPKD